MAETIKEEQVSLKLLVNKKTNKVILAEAGKDFVDVLFSFLTMPLGTIARLVQKDSYMGPVRVGCLSSLYESVTNVVKWTDTCSEMLLRPRNSSEDYCRSLKLNIDDTEPPKYFICNKSECKHAELSTFENKNCTCWSRMTYSVLVKNEKADKGFVNNAATFIVTDDLVVIPNAVDKISIGIGSAEMFFIVQVNYSDRFVLTKETISAEIKFFSSHC
ncbi:uncharacterized protein LOC109815917 [Cajanus cajan]|uniref:uncharacterized protein LOC109815917 n=1 Tax=Cajanus cajan TaxID=3821 RepID=UPI00098D80E6|nr:uncharacterized protein LOC109815917 [Cajanus cajan]